MTVLIVGGGLIVVQLTIQRVLGLKDSGYFRRLREFRIHRMLESLHDHVILCGYGRIGQEIAAQLQRDQVPLVVIETDADRRDVAEFNGLRVLQADATLDETLLDAGLERCLSLVAALPTDAANLYVVLSARGLQPSCRLIARANSDEAATKLPGWSQRRGESLCGRRTGHGRFGNEALALDFMELLAGSDYEIEEFQLSHDAALLRNIAGRSLAELGLGRRSGALVLAIRVKGRLVANPGGDRLLEPGQVLIVLGSRRQLKQFQDLLGKAVDPMPA